MEDGATPPRPVSPDDCVVKGGAHSFQWIWDNNWLTNRVRCQRCGLMRVRVGGEWREEKPVKWEFESDADSR